MAGPLSFPVTQPASTAKARQASQRDARIRGGRLGENYLVKIQLLVLFVPLHPRLAAVYAERFEPKASASSS
jgi:hypothetical protein